MKVAHQGVPVVGLPDGSGAPLAAPLPPVTVPWGAQARQQVPRPTAANGPSLDIWLLDRLFGR